MSVMLHLDVLDLMKELDEIQSNASDQLAAFHSIVQLCCKTLDCQACIIASLDADGRHLHHEASAGHDGLATILSGFQAFGITEDKDEGPKLGYGQGDFLERYNLELDGGDLLTAQQARQYGFNRMLGHCLRIGNEISGYLTILSLGHEHYTETEKSLLKIFSGQTSLILERMRQRSHESLLTILKDVCRTLSSQSPGKALKQVADGVCELLAADTCVVWEYDGRAKKLRVAAATDDVDEEYKLITLDPADECLRDRLGERKVVYIANVCAPNSSYLYKDAARKRKWVSLLTIPIYIDDTSNSVDRLSGMLDVYSYSSRHYKQWEMDALALFAHETALALHGMERRVEELDKIVQQLTRARSEEELFRITLHHALSLVGCNRGWISILDARTGELHIVASQGDPVRCPALKLGQGISGKALEMEAAIRVDDVSACEDYEIFWPDTRSELAMPILMSNVEVRKGTEIKRGTKRLGVLNVESPKIGAFFSLDVDRLKTLVRQTALVYDRIETDRKFARLSQVETDFAHAGRITPEQILTAITEALDFEMVNISLVDHDQKRIKSHYVSGLSKEQEKRFKKMADHPLDSSDVQARIVNSRQIEVLDSADPGFDPKIYDEFGHSELVRVFMPMVSHVGNHVVGTVEAGYKKAVRPSICERDIRLLRAFVDFVTVALQQSKEEALERIMHDLRAPASSLWVDVDFLKRRIKDLPEYKIQNKLDDLALDSELLLLEVSEVERFFGGPQYRPVRIRTVVFRDVVIKSLNQMTGMVSKEGFDPKKIHYNPEDVGKIVLYLDPMKLNNVVLNILRNAVKYSDPDPTKFAIHVVVDETRDEFIIKFKDWGIGIKPEYIDTIFEAGFRTPQAQARCVTGSGLGLYISRQHMREMGGELKLEKNYKPTEFHLILPKKLKEGVA